MLLVSREFALYKEAIKTYRKTGHPEQVMDGLGHISSMQIIMIWIRVFLVS